MTVDSEIIFALAERVRGRRAQALEELYGSMATAWLDEGRPDAALSLAASAGRSGSAGAAGALLRLDPRSPSSCRAHGA